MKSWLRNLTKFMLRRRNLFLLFVWLCVSYTFVRLVSNDVRYVDYGSSMFGEKSQAKDTSTRQSTTEFDFLLAEPLIDKASLSDNDIAGIIGRKIPNFPIEFWLKNKNTNLAYNKTCAKFPQYPSISFNNIYWQSVKTSNGMFYLYAAYYDNRTLLVHKPVIRILGMIDRIKVNVTTYCQLWFNNEKRPVFATVFEYKFIWNKKWGNNKDGPLQPYLIGCKIPKSHVGKVPESVSLVEKICDTSTTNLKIIYNKSPDGNKKNFAVCVKGLDFIHQDLSVRMVEWLELLFILGAEKVYMYDLEVHPNLSKVLKYYENIGKIEVTPITLPGEQPNVPGLIHMYLKSKTTNKRQNELIPYNDCLYKNMYRYKFIVLLDTDEVIMPKSTDNWESLLNLVIPKALAAKNTPRASFNTRNVYFMDSMTETYSQDIPQYMHMLQHVYRSANYTKPLHYVKCFHNTERVLTLHNHLPFACIGGGCSTYSIDTDDAQLQHYRGGCVNSLKKSCSSIYMKNPVKDTTVWRYKDLLVSRVTNVLMTLKFFGKGAETTLGDAKKP